MSIRGLALAALLAAALAPRPAAAIPVFAHRYGLSCEACHTTVPHLTPFGEAFLEHGYRIPEMKPAAGSFPVALRLNLQYGSDSQGGLPKAVVDEVELLMGGAIGSRGSYFAEQYVVDGGFPGRPRDLWAAWRLTPRDAPVAVSVRGGQFTLDLPVDPETFRETTDHYAIWDQTAGDNPFAFFAPKTGLSIGANGSRGLRAAVALVQGHDPGSGLPARGIDRYVFAQQALRNVTLGAYRYDGTRRVGGGDDRFWREGYGAGWALPRVRFNVVFQRGYDVRADAAGALRSSGGFVQARLDLAPRLFAIGRYDATQDRAFTRSLVAGLGYRVARNARLSAFDTLHRDQVTQRARHSLSTALLLAY